MAHSNDGNLQGLYDDAAADLRGLAYKRLGNREDADDVVQEAFLRLHREQGEAKINNPRGFLFRVGWRLIIDQLRRRKRVTVPITSESADIVQIDERTPEDRVRGREELEELVRAVNALPAQARRVFILSRVEGLTYAEIATLLNISRGTVKNHMIRALAGIAGSRFDYASSGVPASDGEKDQ